MNLVAGVHPVAAGWTVTAVPGLWAIAALSGACVLLSPTTRAVRARTARIRHVRHVRHVRALLGDRRLTVLTRLTGLARLGGLARPASAEGRETEAQVPLVADLLSATLASGADPEQAAGAVGHAAGGPLGDALVRASTELRLGGGGREVWGRLAELPGCAGLARCLERADVTGVPAVEVMSRLAAEHRTRQVRASAERARRVAVTVAAPLGLCFLPAFLAVGVAPVVLGLARTFL